MTAAARPADPTVDLELLRRHEPIVRYTLGEAFFPMEVTTYLATPPCGAGADGTSARWRSRVSSTGRAWASCRRGRRAHIPQRGDRGTPSRDGALIPCRVRRSRPRASVAARDGSRASATSRGSPMPCSPSRSSSAAASQEASPVSRPRGTAPRRPASVLRPRLSRGGWTVLQYWFFYAFNDWRSGSTARTTMRPTGSRSSVYLSAEDDGRAGTALGGLCAARLPRRGPPAALGRRRAAAGDRRPSRRLRRRRSHASYFVPGEYQAEQELRLPGWMHVIADAIGRLARQRLRR